MIFETKKCSCGKEYTPETWETIECIGHIQFVPEPLEPWLEYRNCSCGSTMAAECEMLYG